LIGLLQPLNFSNMIAYLWSRPQEPAEEQFTLCRGSLCGWDDQSSLFIV
jgi:hypothetical protein